MKGHIDIRASSPAMARRHMDAAWTFLTRPAFATSHNEVFKFGSFSIRCVRYTDGSVSTEEIDHG